MTRATLIYLQQLLAANRAELLARYKDARDEWVRAGMCKTGRDLVQFAESDLNSNREAREHIESQLVAKRSVA